MNIIALVFLAANAVLLLLLPRRWAPLPLLIGACYMTMGQVIEIGPFHFTVIRMLVAVGVVRVVMRGERLAGRLNALDVLILAWATWALSSSFFHRDPSDALTFRLGMVYNACGVYFLLRIFCRSLDDVTALCRIAAILLVPLAAEMLFEKVTTHNLFAFLGGVPDSPAVREDRIRAQGPFAHAILAGTIGAVSLPLAIALWNRHRKNAILGIAASLAIVLASASSGPVMSTVAAVAALWFWKYRQHMRLIRWAAVLGYIGLALVMKAPAYYIIARVSVTGGSTGWHRARLIESAIEFIDEWWLVGTDYTRHWMPTGVSWSPEHTDITNHYIKMGVVGGLPLMLLFIAVLAVAFAFVGRAVRQMTELQPQARFMVWALGASLFAHAASFIAVSYFDQSFVFLYLTLAAIGSAWSATVKAAVAPAAQKMPYPQPLVARVQGHNEVSR